VASPGAAEPTPAPSGGPGARGRWGGARAALAEPLRLVALAVLTGAGGGLGAVAFRLMIRYCRDLFVELLVARAWPLPAGERHWLLAVCPALGLLLVGLITRRFAPEVRGHGIPQILEALTLRRGRIRPRVGLFGILAPAITLGSLGSAGREGPIALIGAAFGSSLGQLLRRSDESTSLLLACGAAAGVGATFNAPLGGSLFALEVVLGSFALGALVPVCLASITGVVVFDAIWGNALALPAPAYHLGYALALPLMLPLGALAGVLGLAFTRGLAATDRAMERWRAGWACKAVAGGLAVGVLGLWLPQVWGAGYGAVGTAVLGRDGMALLVALLVGKYAATLLTLGSGGSGGFFGPALYLGAMLGGLYGAVAHGLIPGAGSPGLYAVVGLGAVFSASAQAPLTAIMIVLETTGDWSLVVGVAAACALSYLVHSALAADSMDMVRLSRNGIRVIGGAEVRPLQRSSLGSALRPLGIRLWVDQGVAEAREVMAAAGETELPVFRRDGAFFGTVGRLQLVEAIEAGGAQRPVDEFCRTGLPLLPPEASLGQAMRRFGTLSADLLAVGSSPAAVLGTVSRADVLRVYYDRTVLTLETERKVEMLRERDPAAEPGTFREVALPESWAGGGRALSRLHLPPGAVVVSVRRGAQTLVAGGGTALTAGDRVLLYAADGDVLDRAEDRLVTRAPRRRGLLGDLCLPLDWDAAGRPLAGLQLPPGAVLAAVRRGDRLLIPRGDTELCPGDTVTLCADDAEALGRAREALLRAGTRPAGR